MALLNRFFLLLTIIVLYSSCEEKIFTDDVDCSECYVDKPSDFEIEVSLTTEGIENDSVMLLLYTNTFDPYNVIDTFYTKSSPFYILVRINQEYAVAAHYFKNSRTIVAIDGTKPIVKRVSSACDEVCWVVENTTVNVELKY